MSIACPQNWPKLRITLILHRHASNRGNSELSITQCYGLEGEKERASNASVHAYRRTHADTHVHTRVYPRGHTRTYMSVPCTHVHTQVHTRVYTRKARTGKERVVFMQKTYRPGVQGRGSDYSACRLQTQGERKREEGNNES